jgi:putative MATE family efflux protein
VSRDGTFAPIEWLSRALERAGIVDQSRLRPTVELAWPRVITGFARMSQQTADFAMVGIVLGPAALAGLAFAYAYWQIGNRLSVGLAGGTIGQISVYTGAEDGARANLAAKQSVLVALALGVPLSLLGWAFAGPLVALFGAEQATVEYGATYLRAVAPALAFEYLNKVASRIFAGIGDTRTPMVIRAGGAFANVLLNAILIFGFGLGVVGAALGTVVATILVTIAFAWGLLGRRYPGRDPVPVVVPLSRPHFDAELVRGLFSTATPLMLRHLAASVVVFPLLSIVSTFGATTVAAFEIGRRVRGLVNSLSWGYSVASSTLVGQHLGAGEESEAASYGAAIVRLSLVSFLVLSGLVFLFAEPVARLFVSDPEALARATVFVRVAAVSVVFMGLDGAATGALRGAGDTRWPFYGTLVGLYLFALPTAFASAVVGVTALYASMVLETLVPAAVSLYRFGTGRWRSYGRALREGTSETAD